MEHHSNLVPWQLVAQKTKTSLNYSIGVPNNWNVENVLPNFKNFYTYMGTLPYPPCTSDVIWIVMENKVNIDIENFKKLKSILGPNNINPIMTRGVFINSIKKDL